MTSTADSPRANIFVSFLFLGSLKMDASEVGELTAGSLAADVSEMGPGSATASLVENSGFSSLGSGPSSFGLLLSIFSLLFLLE
jgi:hypothetical protein